MPVNVAITAGAPHRSAGLVLAAIAGGGPDWGMTIYHIASRADWSDALQQGEYRVSTRGRTLDQEGFIHASTARQVDGVANAFYADAEDLVVLLIDSERLTAPLKYDPVPGADEPFPHIYGPLNVDAVTGTAELRRDGQGRYVFEG